MRKLGDTIILDFTTHNPSTGAVSDTDEVPTCEVFEGEIDLAILSPAVAKRVGKTGNYRVSIEATTDNGFEVGKSYNVIVSATVNGIPAKARIATFTLDSKRIADLNDVSQESIDDIKEETNKIQDIKDKTDLIPTDPATESTLETKPSLADIEGSTVLAKEATLDEKASQTSVDEKPTLLEIEDSDILAKEATVNTKASQTSIDALNDLSIDDVEGSSLAKEASLIPLAKDATVAKDETVAKEVSLTPLAKELSLSPLAKETTLIEVKDNTDLIVDFGATQVNVNEVKETVNDIKGVVDQTKIDLDSVNTKIETLQTDLQNAKNILEEVDIKTDEIAVTQASLTICHGLLDESQTNLEIVKTKCLALEQTVEDVRSQTTTIESRTFDMVEQILRIMKIQEGRWKIMNDELIIYDEDNTTVYKRFKLSGEQTKAYSERVPV